MSVPLQKPQVADLHLSGSVVRRSSVLASLALSALVLSVFSAGRDSGPESAVVRFHEALRRRDQAALSNWIMSTNDRTSVREMIGIALARIESGADVQVFRVKRSRDESWVAVVYRRPRAPLEQIDWSVRKEGATWKVDCETTYANLRRYFGR